MTAQERIKRIRQYLVGHPEHPVTGTQDLDYAPNAVARFRWASRDYRVVGATVAPDGEIKIIGLLQDREGDTITTTSFHGYCLELLMDDELAAIESLCEYAQDRALSDWERRREN